MYLPRSRAQICLQSQVALQHTCSSYFWSHLTLFSRQEHEQGLRETAPPNPSYFRLFPRQRRMFCLWKLLEEDPFVMSQSSHSLGSVLAKGRGLLLLPGEQACSSQAPQSHRWWEHGLLPCHVPQVTHICGKHGNCSPVQCFFCF